MRTFLVIALFAGLGLAGSLHASAPVYAYGPFPFGGSVSGVVGSADGSVVIAADTVLLRIGADGTLIRAVHAGFGHSTSLAAVTGGFLFAGGGLSDTPWVMKLNDRFEILWAEKFDGDFRPNAIAGADDGSVYVGGYTAVPDGRRAALMKLNADGSVVWRRMLHGSGGWDQIRALQTVKDGVVAAGETQCGASLWKVRRDGTFVWQRCFSVGVLAAFTAVTIAADGGVLAAGHDDHLLIIVKTNEEGLFQWKTQGAPRYVASATDIVESNGQIMVAGGASPDQSGSVLVVAAFAADGKPRWQKAYGPPEEMSGIAHGLAFSTRNAAAGNEGGVVVGLGIGNSVRVLRFTHDGLLGGDCPGASENTIEFTSSQPLGRSGAIETPDFEAPVHHVEAATSPALLSRSTVCSSPPPAIAVSEPDRERNQGREIAEIRKQVSDLLVGRKFAELDALADQWRTARERLDPLYPKLLLLYDTVAGETVAARVGDTAQENLLKEWIAARPSSSTAVLALARYYHTEAFAKRGNSDVVSEKGADEFARYSQAALRLLQSHKELAHVDPQYYAVLISATQDGSPYFESGDAQADVDVIGDAAVFLLPQWSGTVEQYKRLLEIAVAKTKDDLGQTMYARVAWRLVRDAVRDRTSDLWVTYGLDWGRIKQGFLDWSTHSPYPTPLHRLAILAYARKDRATLADLLNRPDVKWDEVAQAEWGSRQNYDSAHSWAFPKVSDLAKPVSPAVTEHAAPAVTPMGPRTWPEVLLDSDVTLTNGQHQHVWAFLVHGPNGVVAVSSLVPFRSPDLVDSPIVQARNKIQAWRIARPQGSGHSILVSGYVTPMMSLGRGVVLAIPQFKGAPLIRPLDVAETSVEMGRKVFVAACSRSEAGCKQHIFEAEVIGRGTGNDNAGKIATKTFSISLDGVTTDDLIGAPVLDEGGFAVGVVLGNGASYGNKQSVDCDDLPFLVNGH